MEFLSPKTRSDLAGFEGRLREYLISTNGFFTKVGAYLAGAGGKRVRPLLVLLSGGILGADKGALLDAAAACEMIHMATLVHDDVMDESDVRRGKFTVNRLWGNRTAVLAGDYLFAKALEVISRLANPRVNGILMGMAREVCDGEIQQMTDAFNADVTEESYMDRIRKKTASFLAASCAVGAVLGGAGERAENALSAYGLDLGLAFQVVDDMLDFEGTEARIGKPVGHDIQQGIVTLPVIFALNAAGAAEASRIRAMIARAKEKGGLSQEEVAEVRDLIIRTGALGRARDTAQHLADRAKSHLRGFPPLAERQDLEAFADYVVRRDR